MCQRLGWVVNMEKSELEPIQSFIFKGYQYDLREGKVGPTLERWQTLNLKIQELVTEPYCQVMQLMPAIGQFTATEKQVNPDWLHMRPIQWNLKIIGGSKYLEKVILIPRSLHPHLKWWLKDANVLQGQPPHPLSHAFEIFIKASREGWDTHIEDPMTRGLWSLLERKLHINYLELKVVVLALKEFHDLCTNKIVLVATDNTTVVAYTKKEA